MAEFNTQIKTVQRKYVNCSKWVNNFCDSKCWTKIGGVISVFFLTISFPRAKHVWFDGPSESRIGSSESGRSKNILLANMTWSRLAPGRKNVSEKTKSGLRGRYKDTRRGRDGWKELYYKFKPIIRL